MGTHARPGPLVSDLVRGVCGGCLFALPLIFTMEMWWIGYSLPTGRVVAHVCIALVFLFGLNALSGFRDDHGFVADAGDAIVSLALGVAISAVTLVALAEIGGDTSLLIGLRQVLILALPVSVGVSLARSQLAHTDDDPVEGDPHRLEHRLGVTVAGGLLLGMSAAPTEEIRMIASRVDGLHLLAITVLSLALAGGTLFVAGFPRQGVRLRHRSRWGEVMLVHAVGLVLSAVMLGAFGFLGGDTSLPEAVAAVVTLALPTTVGAAAGRLVL